MPGRNEGSYIVTEKAYRPFYKKTKIKNNDAYETKGTWEVVNDYMAGPFLNYYIEDAKNNRVLIIEGFVFSPSDRKREYMVEIAAIIKSLCDSVRELFFFFRLFNCSLLLLLPFLNSFIPGP